MLERQNQALKLIPAHISSLSAGLRAAVEDWHQFVWLLMGPKSLILSGGVNRVRRGRFLFLIWGKPAKTDSIKNKRWILLTPQMFEVYVKIELAQKVQVVTEQVCCSLQLHYVIIHINGDDIVLIFL